MQTRNPFFHPVVQLGLSCLMLASCGGGNDGPAIKALPQTVHFGTAPVLALLGTATVTATASSGLPVSFSSNTPAICSVNADSGLVTNLAVGTCVLAADQVGNRDFAPATQALQSIVVAFNPNQTLNFSAAPILAAYGSATVAATSSAGLSVVYSSATPLVCLVDSGTGLVSSIAPGSCTILADQPGNANYNAAAQISQTLSVAAPIGPVTVPGSPTNVTATLGTTSATSLVRFAPPILSGGAPISGYTVRSTAGGLSATASGSPITITCPGSCAGYAFTVAAGNTAGEGIASSAADVLTSYNVTATFREPDTQPNDTIFQGSFVLNSTTGSVTSLTGSLTESMTHINDGLPMTTVLLRYQLSSVPAGGAGVLVTSFALNSTNVYAEGGFAAGSSGLYYGWPTAPSPDAGGTGNSFVTIFVDVLNPLTALSQTQINALAYGDCAPGGMMGDTCMTGYVGRGTMGGYPVSQVITRP